MDATTTQNFTSIEVYQAYADTKILWTWRKGYQHATKAIPWGWSSWLSKGTEIKINRPFKRVHMMDAIKSTGDFIWEIRLLKKL